MENLNIKLKNTFSLLPSMKRAWLTCVAEPNAWPKSIPIMPPVSMLIMKLDRWRSPMPRIQWLTHSRAWELTKWERKERKASGLLHIFRKALLEIEKENTFVSVLTFMSSFVIQRFFTYFRRSVGTCCNTFRKLVTVSARFAFLAKNKHAWCNIWSKGDSFCA